MRETIRRRGCARTRLEAYRLQLTSRWWGDGWMTPHKPTVQLLAFGPRSLGPKFMIDQLR